MIVCSCRAISDRTIDAAIASGAQTLDELTSACRAGGECGGCWPTLQRLLDDGTVRMASRKTTAAA